MRREPAITFRGALRILGHYDRPWLDRLDRLLGGVVLASGVVPGLGAVWGWVDQKNETTRLLRSALDATSNRLSRTGGLARHELVVAAHTTLVLAAFFDALRDRLGERFDEVAFTEAEKVVQGTGEWPQEGALVRHLYTAEVPAPSATQGFHENVTAVRQWALWRSSSVDTFLEGVGFERRFLGAAFAEAVAQRYRSDYLRFATTVPEFKVWADLGEHAATRAALAGLADLLSQFAAESTPRDLRALVGAINRAELDRPVLDVDTDGYGIDAVFPPVRDIFVTPHFRSTAADRFTRIGDEHWWTETVEPGADLDGVLARHFSTPGSTSLPLLLLGHPGAGKSLLTKVLAARLPEATYTVVRVPLRRVDADAHVSTQIQQALDRSTNGRVSWQELADQSEDTIRVVLLDGLDELLQASTTDRGGYLTDIVEFQRTEALMGRPVAVVVTSRTLVADRVLVPDGTPVLKLDDFDEGQIRAWLRAWHEANGSTAVRPVTPEVVLAQRELARQPLLLLMLTLYFADPDVERPDAGLSTVELYERLFDTYARREVTKQAGRVLSEAVRAEAVRTQLVRLSTTALGMVNRGSLSITEAELCADLAALGEPAPAGKRLLGEFFFVHAPEAAGETVRRSYEFLHATFAEYLTATHVAEVLADVAEGAFGRRRFHEPDDELLFALLSYQPLAVRQRTLDFLRQRFAAMDEAEREHVLRTLELLIPAYRTRRPPSRYLDYRPLPPDTVRASAAYSANLVLLRILADPDEEVALATLWPDDPDAWQPTVRLWSAGLDADCYRAMLANLRRVGDTIHCSAYSLMPGNDGMFNELDAARLYMDHDLERRLRFGHAVLHEKVYFGMDGPRGWADSALSHLLCWMTGPVMGEPPDAPESVPAELSAAVAATAYGLLALHCVDWSTDMTEALLDWLMRLPAPTTPFVLPLAVAEHTHPGLLDRLRTEADESWTPEWRDLLLRAATPENLRELDVAVIADYLKAASPGEWPLG